MKYELSICIVPFQKAQHFAKKQRKGNLTEVKFEPVTSCTYEASALPTEPFSPYVVGGLPSRLLYHQQTV